MAANGDEAGGGPQNHNPNFNPDNQSKGSKGKTCTGCLYYSSVLKSKSRNPTCVGIPGTILRVPSVVIKESESNSEELLHGVKDYKYVCIGSSMYLDNKDSLTDQSDKKTELPFCVGLEILFDTKPSSADSVPEHVDKNGDSLVSPQPQPQPRTYQPTKTSGDEYFNRFKRTAVVVASGVARNLNRVDNYMKQSLDDILNRRSK